MLGPFASATVDALSAHIAILDEAGSILAVNRAWRMFNAANSPPGADLQDEGVNYLAVCETSTGRYSEEGLAMAAGIRAVMRGEKEEFALEYPCHSPDEQRWFVGRVTRFPGAGPTRLVVAHETITARKLAEHRLGERVKELEAFYGLAAITERRGITLDEIYQEFVNLLPASWQYPEVACALLVIGDRDFRTANFKASPWLQSEILRAGGVVVGRLEVRYLEERPAADTGPFLQEEQRLLAALATQIGILTERKQTEAALQRERDRLRQILDSQSAFVAVLTLDGTIEEINQTPLTLVGQTRAEVLGRNFLDLGWFEPDVAAQVRELVVAAGRGEMARADIPGDFPKLGRRLVDGVFTPLRDAAGVITHVIAFGMDITEGNAEFLGGFIAGISYCINYILVYLDFVCG